MNALTRIEPVQLGDRTLASVRAAIVNGELAPGEPLRDRQLAEMLGVSRTPVREALHRLEAMGLVVPRGRGGWVVSPFTEQDVRELFQLRLLLEPVGLEELEKTRDAQSIAEISQFFHRFSHPIPRRRFEEYMVEDNAFHKRIVSCSSNRRVHAIYEVLETQIDRGRHFLMGPANRSEETLDEHMAVVEAVADGDFARARKKLVAHLKTGERLMLDRVRDVGR